MINYLVCTCRICIVLNHVRDKTTKQPQQDIKSLVKRQYWYMSHGGTRKLHYCICKQYRTRLTHACSLVSHSSKKGGLFKWIIFLFLIENIEALLVSTHNICFQWEIRKILDFLLVRKNVSYLGLCIWQIKQFLIRLRSASWSELLLFAQRMLVFPQWIYPLTFYNPLWFIEPSVLIDNKWVTFSLLLHRK